MADEKVVEPKRHWGLIFCFIMGCAGGVSAAALAAYDQKFVERGWLMLAASGALILASQFDRVTELSFAGATAKMERKIIEAEQTILRLRLLATALSKPVMTMAVRLGR